MQVWKPHRAGHWLGYSLTVGSWAGPASLCALDPSSEMDEGGDDNTPCWRRGDSKRHSLCSLEFNGHIVLAESIVIVYRHLPTMQEALFFNT